MKKTSLLFALAILLALVIPASGQGNSVSVPDDAVASIVAGKDGISNYIVLMKDNPVVAYEGDISGFAATKPAAGEKINPNSANVVRYASHLRSTHNIALNRVGALQGKKYDYHYTFNGFSAAMTEAQADMLRGDDNVLSVWEDQLGQLDTVTTPDFLGLTGDDGVWATGATGEDVIIGIIDSGIWPESLSFTDRGSSRRGPGTGRLLYGPIAGWHGNCTPGEEFTYRDCNRKLMGAQWFNSGWGGDAGVKALFPYEYASARDTDGHGTHTASTAGGNANVEAIIDGIPVGSVSGMAPRARIAAYKVCWGRGTDGGCFNSDSVAAIDRAVADGVDVLNFSISGTRTNFLDPVEVAFLFAADAGVFVAASAGNAGPAASTVAHNSPWLTTVAAGTHDRYFEGTVTLGNGEVYVGASIAPGVGPADLVYAGDAGDVLCNPGALDPSVVSGKIVVCDRGAIARVDKSLAVQMAGGIGMVHANTTPNSINADLHFVPTVHVDDVAGAAIRAYAQTAGATATLAGGVLVTSNAPDVASFSSRGPALASSDLLKPDIMAPGVDIIAAVSPPGNNGRDFDAYSGTSMSSPHIAGLGALLIGENPRWSPAMVKSALMTTASQETNMGVPIDSDPFGYGAGHVAPPHSLDPGLVYDAGFNDYLAFLCGTGQLTASYCPSIAIDPSDLNYPSITVGELAGEQTVVRTVTNVGPDATYDVSIDAPAGIDVSVSPASLTLASGESASYEVTLTVLDSATLNEYAFGSLTWTHGGHMVRSAITARPVALAAPGSVSGTGTDGSLSFDIQFGYSGDYSAGVHGLVAADMQADNVADDPADDINTALGTCDFSSFPYQCTGLTWHLVNVPAGSLYARFSLFDAYTDGTDDLDLYVWDSAFNFVGGSGSGTSTEEVNVVIPGDTLYQVAVHGWQTDGPDSNYTLFSWAFGPDEGNMTVTAPASAMLGATETITVDWAGLDAGMMYLGGVSHNDAAGMLDLTIIKIDTN